MIYLWLWKHRAHIALITLALAAFFYVRGMGWDACKAQESTTQIEGIKTNGKISERNRRLSDPDLDAALSHWLR